MLRHVSACNFDVDHLRIVVESGAIFRAKSNTACWTCVQKTLGSGSVNGIKIAAFGVVAGGWLSDEWLGKAKPSPNEAAHNIYANVQARLDFACGKRWMGAFQELLRTLRDIADTRNTTIANMLPRVMFQLRNGAGWIIIGGAMRRSRRTSALPMAT